MSEPLTHIEIEDVLSSIRRLVSEDPDAAHSAGRTAAGARAPAVSSSAAAQAKARPAAAGGTTIRRGAAPLLVLTPAFRVVDGDDASASQGPLSGGTAHDTQVAPESVFFDKQDDAARVASAGREAGVREAADARDAAGAGSGLPSGAAEATGSDPASSNRPDAAAEPAPAGPEPSKDAVLLDKAAMRRPETPVEPLGSPEHPSQVATPVVANEAAPPGAVEADLAPSEAISDAADLPPLPDAVTPEEPPEDAAFSAGSDRQAESASEDEDDDDESYVLYSAPEDDGTGILGDDPADGHKVASLSTDAVSGPSGSFTFSSRRDPLTGGGSFRPEFEDVGTIESRIAGLEAAINRSGEEFEPDGSEPGDELIPEAILRPVAGTRAADAWDLHPEPPVQDLPGWVGEDEPEIVEPDAQSSPEDKPAPAARQASSGGDLEEALIDEESLREIVAELVRQELRGEIGEKITRNVRLLIRREVHRAMTLQDLSDYDEG